MSSLGNIESTPYAGLAIADFATGDVLYLTGEAKNLVGKEAAEVMPLQKALTTLKVNGFIFVKDALPVRQVPGTSTELSPYSPPVKLLKEEMEAKGISQLSAEGEAQPHALLETIELHSSTIATFKFRPSVSLKIRPGQAIILDFKTLLGSPQYRHMSSEKPSLVNDDLVRTWTISAFTPIDGTTDYGAFEVTMKEKEGGVVTGALFNIARGVRANRPVLLEDMRMLDVKPNIVGVSGDFFLDIMQEPTDTLLQGGMPARRLLWTAGGIGVTPFVVMLRALTLSQSLEARNRQWDIVFALATREPEVLLPIIQRAHGAAAPTPNIHLHLHIFSAKPIPEHVGLPFSFTVHNGRLEQGWFLEQGEGIKGRDAYVCGPLQFEEMVISALVKGLGMNKDLVKREGFAH